MKALTRLFLCATLLAAAATARADRVFSQAELDALLAPVALYPDNVLSDILVAASYPDDIRQAAAWSRGNPQLRGDAALRAVDALPWPPSVRALTAFPEVLARMDESPAWLADLGEAYRVHGPYMMDTVQSLRRRAQASGYLQSDGTQQVLDDGGAIAIAPAAPQYFYVRYYDPLVVYGPWWWPAYRPVTWRPWPVFGTFISFGFVAAHPDWHRRVVVVNRPVVVRKPVVRAQFSPGREPRRDNGAPSPARQEQLKYQRERERARAPQQGSSRSGDSRRQHPPRQSRSHRDEPRGPQGKFGGSGRRD